MLPVSLSADQRERLLTLLDAVCEQRASAADYEAVEALVLSSDEARWLYLSYMDLHGTLIWDAAGGAGLGTTSDAAAERLFAPAAAAPRRRWGALVSLAASVALVVGIVVGRYALPPGVDSAVLVQQSSEVVEPPVVSPEPVPRRAPIKPVEISAVPTPTGGPAAEGSGSPAGSAAELVPAPSIRPFAFDVLAQGPLDDVTRVSRQIDRELARVWHEYDVTPSPVASDAEWLRRVRLDLTGRIPTVPEVEAFLTEAADTRGTDRRRELVESLLRDGEHVRHLTTVWTNLLIGRTSNADVDRDAFQKYLRLTFAANKPWNAVVADLLSAEGRTDENGATNYLVAHLNNQAVPATAITSRLFLGQQLHCAQCHNHPFNEVQQASFWELNSLFQQTQVIRQNPGMSGPRAAERRKGPAIAALVTRQEGGPIYYEATSGLMKVAFPRFNGQDVDPAPEVNRRQELARLLQTTDQPQLAAAFVNRMWAHFFGAGFTTPVDDMGPHNPPCHPEVLTLLRDEFVASGYDVQQLVRWITATDAYQRASRMTPGNERDDPATGDIPLFSRVYAKPMSVEQLYDSLLTATRAHQAGATDWTVAERQRQEWLNEFVVSLENDENTEAETLTGTYSQALTLMNGDLVQTALDLEPGTFLGDLVRSKLSETERIRRLCVAALSRPPSPKELPAMQRLIRENQTGRRGPARHPLAGYQDLFWALLNSNEFASVH